jgi:hypothetical protein
MDLEMTSSRILNAGKPDLPTEDEEIEAEDDEVSAESDEADVDAGDGAACDDQEEVDEGEMDSEIDHRRLGIDKGDLTDMGPYTDDPGNTEPGHFNPNPTNKGSKTTFDNRLGRTINKGVTGSAYEVLKREFKKVVTAVAGLKAENANLKKTVKKLQAQTIRASTETGRRYIDPQIAGLLKRNNIDPIELYASGEKMTVEQIDAVLTTIPNLDVTTRMTIKNKFLASGLMEQGAVDRGHMRIS